MKIKKNVAISESGYIFNPSTGDSFTVNPIGIEIFNMIKAGKITRKLVKPFLQSTIPMKLLSKKITMILSVLINLHLLIDNGNEK